jgi:hypothetical protein
MGSFLAIWYNGAHTKKKRNFYHPQVSSNQMYTFQGQNCHAKIHFSNYVCVILFVAPDKKLQTIYDIYTLINALFFFWQIWLIHFKTLIFLKYYSSLIHFVNVEVIVFFFSHFTITFRLQNIIGFSFFSQQQLLTFKTIVMHEILVFEWS